MTAPPLVSVLIPTWNRAALLPSAVASVLASTHPSLEVLVLDDGSTDDTPEVAARLAAADGRVRVFRHANVGQSETVNRGLALGRGEIAVMLSDDDVLSPTALASAAAALAADPRAVAAYGDYEILDLEGRRDATFRAGPTTLEAILEDHDLRIGVGAAFRTEASHLAGGWNPGLRFVPDLDFWLRMGLLGTFVYVPESFGGHRRHPGQITGRVGEPAAIAERLAIVERFLARDDLPERLRALAPRARASAYLIASVVANPPERDQGQRFVIFDRRGEPGSVDRLDVAAHLFAIAEERLELIRRLDRAAQERLELIHSLEAEAQKRLDAMLRLGAALEAERAETAKLRAEIAVLRKRGGH